MSEVKNAEEILLTEKAEKEISRIMSENKVPDGYGLRVGVKGGGCSGFTYSLGFDSEIKEGDTVITSGEVKLFVDGKSLFYLNGTEL
jgi:iron-sulfur cluster assembly protein